MCHAERAEIVDWLHGRGATSDDADAIRRKVVVARGEHEAEDEITALWEIPDAGARLPVAARLYAAHPGDARIAYELAGAHDSAGDEQAAVPLYEEALAAGLREPHRHRAQLQLASSLRNVGRVDEAVAVIDDLAARHPDSLGVAAFRALVHHDAGGRRARAGRPAHRGRGDQHRPGRRPLPPGADGVRRRARRPRLTTRSTSDGARILLRDVRTSGSRPVSRPRARSARGRGRRCRRPPSPPPAGSRGRGRGRPTESRVCVPGWACLVIDSSSDITAACWSTLSTTMSPGLARAMTWRTASVSSRRSRPGGSARRARRSGCARPRPPARR